MVGIQVCLEQYEGDEVEIGSAWLLVDWTLVELGIVRSRLDGIHVDDGKAGEEYLVVRLGQAVRSSVPRRPLEEQSVDVDAFL
jgi:hypothetical protein